MSNVNIPGYPGAQQPAPQAQPQYAAPAYPAAQPAPLVQPPYAAPAYPAAQQAQQAIGDIGAAIAGAHIGVERLPRIEVGSYVLRIDETCKPETAVAIVAEFTIVESTNPNQNPGDRVSYYQDLSFRDARQQSARNGAMLAFIVRALGFDSVDQLQTQMNLNQLAEVIRACQVRPGPLKGRMIRCTAVGSGKMTNPRNGGVPVEIVNLNWSVYR